MRQGMVGDQAGFSLLEILLAVVLLVVISAVAVPSLLSFYRQYAVEYETEYLLADIRRAQSISRTAAPAAKKYGAHSQDGQGASILVDRDSYLFEISYGDDAVHSRHHYLPLVHVIQNGQLSQDDFIVFDDNGSPRNVGSMMTLQIFCEGHLAERRQIMISRGGRIRIERGDS